MEDLNDIRARHYDLAGIQNMYLNGNVDLATFERMVDIRLRHEYNMSLAMPEEIATKWAKLLSL